MINGMRNAPFPKGAPCNHVGRLLFPYMRQRIFPANFGVSRIKYPAYGFIQKAIALFCAVCFQQENFMLKGGFLAVKNSRDFDYVGFAVFFPKAFDIL